MRKIKSQAEIDKKKKRNQIIIGVILVGLMMFSTIGYSLMDKGGSTTKTVKYAGLNFISTNGIWTIEGTQMYFNHLPTELGNVSIEGNYSLESYSNQTLYFVNYSGAGELLINNLQGKIARYQEACLDSACGQDLPVKNCSKDLVIVFSSSTENRVYQKDKCVFIGGDYTQGVDAFVYKLFGII